VRIIAGKWRGKKLVAPDGLDVRPTSDRARGALYNVLLHGKPVAYGFRLRAARVLDGFAGTGALGLESLSRGAAHVTFMENAAASLDALKSNIAACGAKASAKIMNVDVTSPPRGPAPCNLVFLDPPYGQGLVPLALESLDTAGWIAEDAICCVELGKAERFDPPGNFALLDDRRYGAARIVILTKSS